MRACTAASSQTLGMVCDEPLTFAPPEAQWVEHDERAIPAINNVKTMME